jgi:hypothetical protein
MPGFPNTARIGQLFVGSCLAAVLLLTGLQFTAFAKPGPLERYLERYRPLAADTDRDGLSNWTENNRTRTRPRVADTDGDGLSDGAEVRRTKTNPRKADTDGDGAKDGDEVAAGSNPRNPASLPPANPTTPPGPPAPPPPPPVITPVQAVWNPPAVAQVSVPVVLDGTSSTGETCTWLFENQSGSLVFDEEQGCLVEFTFKQSGTKHVRLVVEGTGGSHSNKQSFTVAPGSPAPDTTPPNTTISAGPSGTTTSTEASLSFSSSESGSSFECKLDAGSFGACSSPQSYAGLALGAHTFSVRATDKAGNTDLSPATRTWTVEEESTTPPPPDTTPPNTTISSGPSGTTTSTSASFSFSSSESGSTFECQLDSGSFGACSSPQSYAGLALGAHTFSVRATDKAGNTDLSPATRTWTVEEESTTPPPTGGCVAGATQATSAAQVRSAVQSDKDVCVIASVGDVSLDDLGSSPVTISTDGGSLGRIYVEDTTDLTIQSARFRSIEMRNGHRTHLFDNTIGGTPTNRVLDQLIFMPDESVDVRIEGNDIGWTSSDTSGNTGYGCRCYGETHNLRFVGNKVHDIAADGFQGTNGDNVLIDRNEIGPVGANPGSTSHSDNIQIVGNGPNLRITNNWIHHQGYYEGTVVGNSGSTYIHGGTSNSVLYENNLIEIARGRTEICGLGTGGKSRSNITVRSNTWVEGGQTFNNFPGFAWECDSGTGNTVERNIAIDPDGGFALTGSSGSATFSANIWGKPGTVTLDSSGNCTSANCNPAGQPAIGYRKPSGVDW